jgi:hypothetical protein
MSIASTPYCIALFGIYRSGHSFTTNNIIRLHLISRSHQQMRDDILFVRLTM